MHFSTRRHIHANEAVRHASLTGATPRAIARFAEFRDDWWDAAEDIAIAMENQYVKEYDEEAAKAYHDMLRLLLLGA